MGGREILALPSVRTMIYYWQRENDRREHEMAITTKEALGKFRMNKSQRLAIANVVNYNLMDGRYEIMELNVSREDGCLNVSFARTLRTSGRKASDKSFFDLMYTDFYYFTVTKSGGIYVYEYDESGECIKRRCRYNEVPCA